MKKFIGTAALLIMSLTACGGTGDDTTADDVDSSTSSPAAAPSDDGGVDWGQYAPGVRKRIDEAAENKSCDGLQAEFDNAEANSNPDLMEYIDAAMREAGCYE